MKTKLQMERPGSPTCLSTSTRTNAALEIPHLGYSLKILFFKDLWAGELRANQIVTGNQTVAVVLGHLDRVRSIQGNNAFKLT